MVCEITVGPEGIGPLDAKPQTIEILLLESSLTRNKIGRSEEKVDNKKKPGKK